VDAQVEFVSDSAGKTDHLILYQNGQKVTAKKLGPDRLSPVPTARKEISVDTNTLKKYIGEYEFVPAFHIVITLENGALQGQATGQPKFAMYAEKTNFFFLKVVDAQIEFFSDTAGNTDHLILYQNRLEQKGKKIK
jgi:hypothetical protein